MTTMCLDDCPRRGGPVFWTGAGLLALMAAVLGTVCMLQDAEAMSSDVATREAQVLTAHLAQLRDPSLPADALDTAGLPFGATELYIEGRAVGNRVEVVAKGLSLATCQALASTMGPGGNVDAASVNGSEFLGPDEFVSANCVADRETRYGNVPQNRVVFSMERASPVVAGIDAAD
jgi:hypothetical protein